MGKLVVVSPSDSHTSDPSIRLIVNGPAAFIGRVHDPETGTYPIDRVPAEFHDDGSRLASRIRRLVSRGELWAADESTARACGVEFVPRKYDTISKSWVVQEKRKAE